MKRIIVGLLVGFLTMAGFVGVSSSPATAACPYTNCVATNLNTSGPSSIARGRQARIKIGVRAASNVDPRGTIRLTVYRAGKRGVVTTKSKAIGPTRPTNDGLSKTTMVTPRLRPGFYKLVFRFIPTRSSLFKASSGSRTLRIRR